MGVSMNTNGRNGDGPDPSGEVFDTAMQYEDWKALARLAADYQAYAEHWRAKAETLERVVAAHVDTIAALSTLSARVVLSDR